MERWEKGRFERTIKKLSQSDDKKTEELESELDHFDLHNSYPTSAVTSWIWISYTNNYLMGIKLAKPNYL